MQKMTLFTDLSIKATTERKKHLRAVAESDVCRAQNDYNLVNTWKKQFKFLSIMAEISQNYLALVSAF